MAVRKKYIWEDKTDTELKFWPRKSQEHYLSSPTLPQHLVKKRNSARISAPEKLSFDVLATRGIINAAMTIHMSSYYQSRAKEKFSIVVFTISGKATVSVGKRKYVLTRGSVFVSPANSEYVLQTKEKWKNIWFHLDPSSRWRSIGESQAYIKRSSRCSEIKNLVDMWLAEIHKHSRSIAYLEALADAIVSCLRDELIVENEEKSFSCDEIISRLQNSEVGKLSALEASKHFGVSIYALDKICMRARSEKFAKILLSIKMKKACDILRAGYSIEEVASECGYSDRASFSKAFKRYYGVSPSEFR
jgi:AraC-like DNA-binding protein